MTMTIKLTGMRELGRALGNLPKAVARRSALAALRKGAEPVAKAARSLAPQDEGNLIESIEISATLSRAQAGYKGAVAPVEMHIGPSNLAGQGILQEFGTWFHPAQPFMRPAWAITKIAALDLTGAHLGIEVEKAAIREARKTAAARVAKS